jgi:hypothetical protein
MLSPSFLFFSSFVFAFGKTKEEKKRKEGGQKHRMFSLEEKRSIVFM